MKNLYTKLAVMLIAVTGVLGSMFACAEDTTVLDMTTAFTGIKTTIFSGIGAIAPVALTVVGLFLAWRYGLKFFKSVSK